VGYWHHSPDTVIRNPRRSDINYLFMDTALEDTLPVQGDVVSLDHQGDVYDTSHRQGNKSIDGFGKTIEELMVNLTLAQADEDGEAAKVFANANEKIAISVFANGLSNPESKTKLETREQCRNGVINGLATPNVSFSTSRRSSISRRNSGSTLKCDNVTKYPDKKQIEEKLQQIREYLKITNSLMISMKNTDEQITDKAEKGNLEKMINDLKDSENKLINILDQFNSSETEEGSKVQQLHFIIEKVNILDDKTFICCENNIAVKKMARDTYPLIIGGQPEFSTQELYYLKVIIKQKDEAIKNQYDVITSLKDQISLLNKLSTRGQVAVLEAKTAQKCTDIINLTEELFTKVGDNSTVRAAVRPAFLHVYNLHPDTSREDLQAIINDALPEASCEKLNSRYPKSYSSFKVTVPQNENMIHGGVAMYVRNGIECRALDLDRFNVELDAEFCGLEELLHKLVVITTYRSGSLFLIEVKKRVEVGDDRPRPQAGAAPVYQPQTVARRRRPPGVLDDTRGEGEKSIACARKEPVFPRGDALKEASDSESV
ncbi:hypothetical protein NQ317_014476, partial [Molorchus minor]